MQLFMLLYMIILHDIETNSRTWGLNINTMKIKVMIFENKDDIQTMALLV